MLELSLEDFKVVSSQHGLTLQLNQIPGICLVLFFSPKCKYCRKIFPFYKELRNEIAGVNFLGININKYPKIISLSRKTLSPIEHVPYLILYVNSIPVAAYNEEKFIKQKVAQFAIEVGQEYLNKINQYIKYESECSNNSRRSNTSLLHHRQRSSKYNNNTVDNDALNDNIKNIFRGKSLSHKPLYDYELIDLLIEI